MEVTNQPVKYVIYSHHHFDHIAGGKAFKDAGATFIAHRRAKERLEMLKDPHTVLPDEAVPDSGRTITLGGTTLELHYLGLNHSDSTLVMRLPKEKIIFIVDTIPASAGMSQKRTSSSPLTKAGPTMRAACPSSRGVIAVCGDVAPDSRHPSRSRETDAGLSS